MVSCGIDRQNMMLSERYTWNTYDIYWSTIHTRAVGHVECLVFRVVASGAAQASFKSETWLWDMCGTCVGHVWDARLVLSWASICFSLSAAVQRPGWQGWQGWQLGWTLSNRACVTFLHFRTAPTRMGQGMTEVENSRKVLTVINGKLICVHVCANLHSSQDEE